MQSDTDRQASTSGASADRDIGTVGVARASEGQTCMHRLLTYSLLTYLHALPELIPVDLAIAVLIELSEEVHHPL